MPTDTKSTPAARPGAWERAVRARKEHQCADCRKPIEVTTYCVTVHEYGEKRWLHAGCVLDDACLVRREATYRTALELIRERDTEYARLQDRHDELRTFAAELTSVGTRIHIDHEKREYSLLRQYERPVLTSADWRVICSAQRELLALAKTLTGGRAAGRGDD